MTTKVVMVARKYHFWSEIITWARFLYICAGLKFGDAILAPPFRSGESVQLCRAEDVHTFTRKLTDRSRLSTAASSALQLGHSSLCRYATKPSRGEQPMWVSRSRVPSSSRTIESSDIASSVRSNATWTSTTLLRQHLRLSKE